MPYCDWHRRNDFTTASRQSHNHREMNGHQFTTLFLRIVREVRDPRANRCPLIAKTKPKKGTVINGHLVGVVQGDSSQLRFIPFTGLGVQNGLILSISDCSNVLYR
jgi:hypothetical protein